MLKIILSLFYLSSLYGLSGLELAIKMQERAGVDYISDGEWRRESYVKVFADSVSGFEKGLISDPTGVSGLEYPAIVSNMKKIDDIAVSEAVFLKNITQSKTIIALPAPYTIGRRMWSPEHSSSAYETSDDLGLTLVPLTGGSIKYYNDYSNNVSNKLFPLINFILSHITNRTYKFIIDVL